jgi:hypothetical protein
MAGVAAGAGVETVFGVGVGVGVPCFGCGANPDGEAGAWSAGNTAAASSSAGSKKRCLIGSAVKLIVQLVI